MQYTLATTTTTTTTTSAYQSLAVQVAMVHSRASKSRVGVKALSRWCTRRNKVGGHWCRGVAAS